MREREREDVEGGEADAAVDGADEEDDDDDDDNIQPDSTTYDKCTFFFPHMGTTFFIEGERIFFSYVHG